MAGATIPYPSATVNETAVRIATSRGRSRNGPRLGRGTTAFCQASSAGPPRLGRRPARPALADGRPALADGRSALTGQGGPGKARSHNWPATRVPLGSPGPAATYADAP